MMNIILVNVVFILFTIVMIVLFSRYGFIVKNFEGEEVPYSLGIVILFGVVYTTYFFSLEIAYLLYVSVIWLIGLIDDRYGVSSPKGLKGHFLALLKDGKLTTGLLKVIGTFISATMIVIYLQPNDLIVMISYFLLLVLTPHIMNLFDTRPLRVWKVTFLHLSLVITVLLSLPFSYLFFLLIGFVILYIAEGRKQAMLGDNGATAIGAILSLLVITHVEQVLLWALISMYVLLTIAAEKISFTKLIEKNPLIRRIDRWGTS